MKLIASKNPTRKNYNPSLCFLSQVMRVVWLVFRGNLFVILTILALFLIFSQNADASSVTQEKFPDGMTVITKNIDSGDIVSFSILIKLSVYHEESYVQGIRAFLSELIEEKIKNAKTSDGISLIEYKGVSVKSQTEADYIAFRFVCKKEDFLQILDITSKAVANPASEEAVFASAKKKFREKYKNINGIIDNVYSLFLASFYRYHPYKLINQYSLSAIDRIEQKKTTDFLKKTISKDRIIISLAGNFNREKAIEIIKSNFENLSPAAKKFVSIQWEPQAIEKQLFLSALSNKGWLLLGFTFPSYSSPDYPEMLIAKNIIGEGFNSRFWMELREKRGYAYELGALAPTLEGPAHVMFYIVTQPKNIMQARKIACEIIEDVKKNGVTEKELEIAKEKALGSLFLIRESSSGLAFDVAVSEAVGGDYNVELNLKNKIKKVTSADVKRAVNKYFQIPVIIIVRPPGLYINDTYL